MPPKDDRSVSSAGSSGSTGSGGFLSGLFGNATLRTTATITTTAPVSPQPKRSEWGQHSVIPKYEDKGRMLMRSPLPSPTQGFRKKLVKPHVKNADDSDSEDGRHQREEAHITRLVNMAKAQQNLMTAWFAASAGAEDVTLSLPPLVRRSTSESSGRRRPRPVQRNSSGSSNSSGPIDLDSGSEWDASEASNNDDNQSRSDSSTISSASSLRNILGRIIGPNSNESTNTKPSVFSGETPKISNVKTQDTDLEVGTDGSYDGSKKGDNRGCTRNRIILCVLLTMFILALLTVIISLLASHQQSRRNRTNAQRPFFGDDDQNDDGATLVIMTPEPTALASASPSTLFPSDVPSNPPSDIPSLSPTTPTGSPSSAPSSTPTSIPTESPSTSSPSSVPTLPPPPTSLPSAVPTGQPTDSPSSQPSLTPTVSPTVTPSATPSVTPTLTPTASPSSVPSMTPSIAPSLSAMPSSEPSSSPTTIFSTTMLDPLGPLLTGGEPGDQFGYAISVSGDGKIMAVGARYHSANGISRAGMVQVYFWDGADWIERGQALLGRNALDQFGFSVALSQDGRRLAVSEPGFDGPAGDRAGNVRVFQWVENLEVWTELGQEIGGEQIAELFGVSVVLSGDGRRLAIGSPYHDGDDLSLSGRVLVYQYIVGSSQWDRIGEMRGNESLDWFGWDVDLSFDGTRVIAGAPRNIEYGGFVQAYDYDGKNWTQVGGNMVNNYGDVRLDDRYGLSVSLDNDRIAVGCPWKDIGANRNTGSVMVYELQDDNNWVLVGEPLTGIENFQQMGFSVQIQGEFLSVGSPGAYGGNGDASFHRWTGELWDTVETRLAGTKSSQDLGYAVAMSNDATIIAASSPATGTQVYQR